MKKGILNTGQKVKQDPQEAFDKLSINALKLIHEDKLSNGFIKRIKSTDDTTAAIGETAVEIIMKIEGSAKQNQIEFELEVIVNGLNMIVGELINICEAAGAAPLDEEQRYQAFAWALSKYLDYAVKAGKITQEQLIEMTQEIESHASQKPEDPGMAQPPEEQPMEQMPQGGM